MSKFEDVKAKAKEVVTVDNINKALTGVEVASNLAQNAAKGTEAEKQVGKVTVKVNTALTLARLALSLIKK